ncbi:MAG: hypothetical protein AAFN50_14635, partial [Pseudomonadota bacterium]
MNFRYLLLLILIGTGLAACGGDEPSETSGEPTTETSNEIVVTDTELEGNPFRMEWDTPYGVPPFAEIDDSHYMPAIKKG